MQTSTPSFSTELIKHEGVKCVFKGTLDEQKCHTTDTNYTCVGKESCLLGINAKIGSKITLTSFCGGTATIEVDGRGKT